MIKWSLARAILPWLTARILLLLALTVARAQHGGVLPRVPAIYDHVGLFTWDSGWYRDIAVHGYAPLPREALRFFPLLPLLGRGVGEAVGHVGGGVLLVANLGSLCYVAALAYLARVELGDEKLARRTAWLAALSPGAVVLALGYPEGLEGFAAVLFFLGIRRDRYWLAAVAGTVAGLARPVGILLCVAGAVEFAVHWRVGVRQWMGRLLVLVSPLVGTGAYLLYVREAFGSATLPYSVTNKDYLHGPGLSNPLTQLPHILPFAGRFDVRFDIALVVLAIALCVACLWVLPVSYAAWSAATIVVSITSSTESSLARYLFSAFPLVITAVVLASRRGVWTGVLALSAGTYAVLAVLGFTPLYTL